VEVVAEETPVVVNANENAQGIEKGPVRVRYRLYFFLFLIRGRQL
jgi:hypothetical protein